MNQKVSSSLEDTGKIAKEWLAYGQARPRPSKAFIVGLAGNLGAGKTTFTKVVAELLGIAETVTSPTFVIMKSYPIDPSKGFVWKKLIHIDAYRLKNSKELEVLGFDKSANDPDNLIIIEWPENVREILVSREQYSQINFGIGEGETVRTIEFVW